MERVEELLLNFALNWCAGRFRRAPSAPRKPHPYRSAPPADEYVFAADDYFRFVQWLRDARVIAVRPQLPEEIYYMQSRLDQRHVRVEAMDRNAETGVMIWPRDLPRNVAGIFSDPNVIRSLPGRGTVMALLPATGLVLQEVRSWNVKAMDRLDLLWARNSRFKDFMRRNLERVGLQATLTPDHFQFLSQWMLVELQLEQQRSEQWYWPLPVCTTGPLPPPPQQQQQQPLPPAPLVWVMPGQELGSLPPLTTSFVIGAEEPRLPPPDGPSNTPAETRAYTAAPPPLPPATEPPRTPPPHEYRPSDPWSFSE